MSDGQFAPEGHPDRDDYASELEELLYEANNTIGALQTEQSHSEDEIVALKARLDKYKRSLYTFIAVGGVALGLTGYILVDSFKEWIANQQDDSFPPGCAIQLAAGTQSSLTLDLTTDYKSTYALQVTAIRICEDGSKKTYAIPFIEMPVIEETETMEGIQFTDDSPVTTFHGFDSALVNEKYDRTFRQIEATLKQPNSGLSNLLTARFTMKSGNIGTFVFTDIEDGFRFDLNFDVNEGKVTSIRMKEGFFVQD